MNAQSEVFEEQVTTVTALEALNKSEIDIAISTAHRFPRSILKFKNEALAMATLDEETASSCFYVLKRENKNIEGPSVRLAEIIGSAWGNLRYGARVISIDDKFVSAQGVCHDLEKNISANVEVRRRITMKDGRRYSDDMIGVTCNAACSIALRNAIFKVVPFTYAKDIYEKAKKVAVGDTQTLSTRRQQMVSHFSKMAVTLAMILELLEKPSIEDVGLEDLATLKGIATAIKDGDSSVDEVFGKKEPAAPAKTESSGLSESLKKSKATRELNSLKSQIHEVLMATGSDEAGMDSILKNASEFEGNWFDMKQLSQQKDAPRLRMTLDKIKTMMQGEREPGDEN